MPGDVLLVEDELRLAQGIQRALNEVGISVVLATSLGAAEGLWRSECPKAVVLDRMLPDGDGLDLLHRMRGAGSTTPVLVLSAKSSMAERVRGLESGADDYLGKPFGLEELLARIRAMLRRHLPSTASRVGDLVIESVGRRVTRGERRIFLSETEFRILEVLAQSPGKPVSKAVILREVWEDSERDDNVVEVYVSYLRGKLEWGGASRLIHTVRGRGYLLAEQEDDA